MKLGLIGCGRMGTALAAGAIHREAVAAGEVLAYDLLPAALDSLVRDYQVRPAASVGGDRGRHGGGPPLHQTPDVPAALRSWRPPRTRRGASSSSRWRPV